MFFVSGFLVCVFIILSEFNILVDLVIILEISVVIILDNVLNVLCFEFD